MTTQPTTSLTRRAMATEYRGDHTSGEIEIVTDPPTIALIAGQRRRRTEELKLPEGAAEVGTVFEDEYIIVRRDPVRFPQGSTGTYLRVIERAALDGAAGVVMLPVRDGLLYLRHIFRHPTRAWELECPRGFREKGFDPTEMVHKEMAEEIGIAVENIVPLGAINANSGLLAGNAQAFWVMLAPGDPQPQPEEGEAFGDIVKLSFDEVMTKIRDGEIRDGFTLSALQLAQAHNLLSF